MQLQAALSLRWLHIYDFVSLLCPNLHRAAAYRSIVSIGIRRCSHALQSIFFFHSFKHLFAVYRVQTKATYYIRLSEGFDKHSQRKRTRCCRRIFHCTRKSNLRKKRKKEKSYDLRMHVGPIFAVLDLYVQKCSLKEETKYKRHIQFTCGCISCLTLPPPPIPRWKWS